MKLVPLKELCTFRHGGTPAKSRASYWQGDIPWVSPKDMKSSLIDDATDHISAEAVRGSATSVVSEGAILVVVRSGILAHSLPIARVGRPVAFNQDIKAIVPCSELASADFLFWFIRAQAIEIIARGVKKGATVHSVQSGFIENLLVPLPSMDEQRRVIDVLSRAQGIVRLRREAQKKTAELIPAIFVEMFGDPATNPKGWPEQALGDLIESIDSGSSPKCHDREKLSDEWGVLRLSALSGGVYDETEHKTLPAEIAPNHAHEVRKGDVLMGRKNTYELVGTAAYVWETSGQMLLPDLIFRFAFKQDSSLLPVFLWGWLGSEFARKRLRSLAGGSAGSMPNISKQRLRGLMLPLPPVELQSFFCARVESVRSILRQQSDSLQKATATFDSLLARAFDPAVSSY